MGTDVKGSVQTFADRVRTASENAGSLICVIEAMKMENEIVAQRAGVVAGLAVATGEQVANGQLLCRIEAAGDGRV